MHYYGPYDKLLNYCFGRGFTFYVAPQKPSASDSRDTGESTAFLVVYNVDDKPVLIVGIKDDSWAQKAELRYRTDKQKRDQYGLMLDDCPIPRLWGLCGDKASYYVTPQAALSPAKSLCHASFPRHF
ncbi:hypothetical protein M413DRAFT_32477 [Hebeloma cylindrosporum]|uniref:Uncharacterized protein n=1 Tax=Hebeloma cylindrosporum TaxID=76867 RepID=A0A0C2XBX2_HEBCY|nr:hypothetical protein M413DRAFT_32477 [Hebeloma cylindrosporum h7]